MTSQTHFKRAREKEKKEWLDCLKCSYHNQISLIVANRRDVVVVRASASQSVD